MQKQTYNIKAAHREVRGNLLAQIRAKGGVPAVMYGSGIENVTVTLESGAFEKVYREAGESSLVDLCIDGCEPIKVLIHDIQRDTLSGRPLHVDLYRVNMTEKLMTHIPLVFTGEAKAVKEQGGILVKNISEIEVRCLPGDLVPDIEVSLDALNELEDSMKIKDILLPKGIEISSHHDREDIVVIVTPPLSEEELKKLEQEGSIKPPVEVKKVEEKEKNEERE